MALLGRFLRGTPLAEMGTVNLRPQIPVAVFLTRFDPGGTERQMIELIRRLDPSQFDVHVACFHRDGAWLPRVTERVASVVEFPIRGFVRPSTLAALAAFARWCRRERIAVVQTCDFYANILGLPGAALAGVPVRIGSQRDLNVAKTAGQTRLQRWTYRCATKIVANCSAARRMLEGHGIATASIAVIPNGVEEGLHPARERAAPGRRRSVITVANLRAEKNHETLIEAAARLAGEFPDLEVLFVGDGPRRGALERLVREKGLQSTVSFLGHREDVPALLSRADVFVLPSRTEAFPNGVLEAMAAGLPVVASAVGGLLDLIDDGRTGILVPSGNEDRLAAAIRRLLIDPGEAQRLGDAARADVTARYSFERMVESFEDLYLASLPGSVRSAVPSTRSAET
jgi:glycosyltransferase involved in cell wall biosynthesis